MTQRTGVALCVGVAVLVGTGCAGPGRGDADAGASASTATSGASGSAFEAGFLRPARGIVNDDASEDADPAPGPGPAEEARTTEVLDVELRPVQAPEGAAAERAAAGGRAAVTLLHDRGELCVELTVSGLTDPTSVHLEESSTGGEGEVVLALKAPSSGDASIDVCVSASNRVLERIRRAPSAFSIRVNTVTAPDGAVQGRLR